MHTLPDLSFLEDEPGERMEKPDMDAAGAVEPSEALRLMEDADALVARLDLDGLLPEVQTSSAMVASAYHTLDLETLNFACSEFAVAMREISKKAPADQPAAAMTSRRATLKTGVTDQSEVGGVLIPPATDAELEAEREYERLEHEAINEHGGG